VPDIAAGDVKALRELTGAGIMDCKEALREADGDFERAANIAREKLRNRAAKEREERARPGHPPDAGSHGIGSTSVGDANTDRIRWEYARVVLVHSTGDRGQPVSTVYSPGEHPVEERDAIPSLTRLGGDGWELVSVVQSAGGTVESYFLKRRH
jgi:hypothetical protein